MLPFHSHSPQKNKKERKFPWVITQIKYISQIIKQNKICNGGHHGNFWFSDVFKGYKEGILIRNGWN